jgi:hypothetical protein
VGRTRWSDKPKRCRPRHVGDEGKAARRSQPAALLFELSSRIRRASGHAAFFVVHVTNVSWLPIALLIRADEFGIRDPAIKATVPASFVITRMRSCPRLRAVTNEGFPGQRCSGKWSGVVCVAHDDTVRRSSADHGGGKLGLLGDCLGIIRIGCSLQTWPSVSTVRPRETELQKTFGKSGTYHNRPVRGDIRPYCCGLVWPSRSEVSKSRSRLAF